MALQLTRRKFTISEFEHMLRKGVFEENERIELISGEIVDMSPIELAHMVCVSQLQLLLHEIVGRSAHIWVQNALRMQDNSRPQPDVMLLKWREDAYRGKHPTPEDVLLLVEVADTSLSYDRKVKGALYAASGIQDYWIATCQRAS